MKIVMKFLISYSEFIPDCLTRRFGNTSSVYDVWAHIRVSHLLNDVKRPETSTENLFTSPWKTPADGWYHSLPVIAGEILVKAATVTEYTEIFQRDLVNFPACA